MVDYVHQCKGYMIRKFCILIVAVIVLLTSALLPAKAKPAELVTQGGFSHEVYER
ncbi:MAG: hypothetical protein H7Y09_14370 [Chitinophagaceae bacterium]|nr:hypothetical protein [Anaerolineae bacterium]